MKVLIVLMVFCTLVAKSQMSNIIDEGVDRAILASSYEITLEALSNPWSLEALLKAGVYNSAPYDLLNPDIVCILPETLKEISGISFNSAGELFCVQDELGIVFQYDIEKTQIKNQIKFASNGDFEDLTIKGDSIFVLRSDGNIYGFKYPFKGNSKQYAASIDAKDYESLSYNYDTNLFYILSKDAGIYSGKSKRVVYSFEFNNISNPKAEVVIDIKRMNEVLLNNHPSLEKKKFNFNPSAIAIHPKTKDFYILSANDRLLVLYNSKGLKAMYPLPYELYYKPEGMEFAPDGTLYITSEGNKSGVVKGMIFKFSPR